MSSSWAAFLPTNIAKHPGNFVGPNVAGTIVQAFETGILVNQASRFWSGASEERTCTKLLVSFVSLAAWYVLYTGWRGLILIAMNFSFQTCIAFYNTWRLIVLGFGEWVSWGFIILDYHSYLVIFLGECCLSAMARSNPANLGEHCSTVLLSDVHRSLELSHVSSLPCVSDTEMLGCESRQIQWRASIN